MSARPAAGLADCIRSAVRRVTDAAPTDADLLTAFARDRDPAAFEALVRRHGTLVANVCRGVLASPADADDAAQATFVVLSRKAASVRPHTLPGWLFRVARRAALEVRRLSERRRIVETNGARPEAVVAPDLSWREAVGILHEELDRLPARYREPLVLCYLDGRARDEAAAALHCSIDALRGRLDQGRAKLGARLRTRGVAPSAGLLAAAARPGLAPAGVARNILSPSASVEAVARAVAAPARAWAVGSLVTVAATLFLGIALVEVGTADPPKKAGPAKEPAAPPRAATALPDGAVARLGTLRFNHGANLDRLLYTPDGKTIVSAGRELARVWDATTGVEGVSMKLENVSWDGQVAVTPDGKFLVFLGQEFNGDVLQTFDRTTGKELRKTVLPTKRNEVSIYRRNAVSADGSRCVVLTPKKIHVFDIPTATELCLIPRVGADVSAVTFAGPGHIVTADKDHEIEVWDARTGAAVRSFHHDGPAGTLAGSPDGRFVATLAHHTEAVDRLIEQDAIQVWDVGTGKRLHKFTAPGLGWFRTLAVSPDSKRVGGPLWDGYRGRTLVWDAATGKQSNTLNLDGTAMALPPDPTRVALGGGHGKFDVWDLATRQATDPGAPEYARAKALFLAPSGDTVSTLGYGDLKTWDVRTGDLVRAVPIPMYPYQSTDRQISPDGRYAAAVCMTREGAGVLHVWDAAAGRSLHQFPVAGLHPQVAVAFSADSTRLAYRAEGKAPVISVREVRSGKELVAIPDADSAVSARLSFSPDGETVISAGNPVVGYAVADGKVKFSWSPEAAAPLRGRPRGRSLWRNITLSPDGRLAAFVRSRAGELAEEHMENRLGLADARTGRVLREWSDTGFATPSFGVIRFSPDSRLLATSDGSTVRLWDVATGAALRTFRGHRAGIESLAFRADGRTLASSAQDSTVVVWDLAAPPAAKSDPAAWWKELLAADAAKAWAAVWHLADAPDNVSLSFLREHLKPATAADAEKTRQLVRDLDSDRFPVREKAAAELTRLGYLAGPALQAALAAKPSAEARQRIEALLDKLAGPPGSGEALRIGRALAALERKGTPEAKRLLKELAGGTDGSWLTHEARAALARSSP